MGEKYTEEGERVNLLETQWYLYGSLFHESHWVNTVGQPLSNNILEVQWRKRKATGEKIVESTPFQHNSSMCSSVTWNLNVKCIGFAKIHSRKLLFW